MIKKGTRNHRRRRLEKKKLEEMIEQINRKQELIAMQIARDNAKILIEQERSKRLKEYTSNIVFELIDFAGICALLMITAFNW